MLDYLEDRYFRVDQGGEVSSHFPVEASVPQGSVLDQFLYNVYADMPKNSVTLLPTISLSILPLKLLSEPSRIIFPQFRPGAVIGV